MKCTCLWLSSLLTVSAHAAVITGTIRNEDGKGVSDWEVAMVVDKDRDGPFAHPIPLLGEELPERNVRLTTRTDIHGSFSFEVTREDFTGTLELYSETNLFVYQNTRSFFRWKTNEPVDHIEILMLPAVTISGRVVAADQAPVPNLAIHALSGGQHRNLPLWTHTAETGVFTMPLPYGEYQLQVVDNHALRDWIVDPDTERLKKDDGPELYSEGVDLTITPGTVIGFMTLTAHPSTIVTGMLVDTEGHPITHQRLDVRSGGLGPSFHTMTRTDREGAFRVDLPISRTAEVVFELENQASGTQTVIGRQMLKPGIPAAIALTVPQGRITGTIHVSEAYPLKNYHLMTLLDLTSSKLIARVAADEPSFEITSVPDGDFELGYTSLSWPAGMLRKRITVADGGLVEGLHLAPGDITLCGTHPDAARFTNVVTRDSGPMIGAILISHSSGGPYIGWRTQGELRPDGRFCISNLYEGTVRLETALPGVQVIQSIEIRSPATEVTLHALGTQTLRGQIHDEEGRPLTIGTVVARLQTHEADYRFLSQADSNGVFEINHLPEGRLDLVAMGNATIAPRIQVTIPYPAEELLTLTVTEARGAIEVHVSDRENLQHTMPVIPISLSHEDGFLLYPMLAVETNSLLIPNLPDGMYMISATYPIGETNRLVTVSGGRTNRVVINGFDWW